MTPGFWNGKRVLVTGHTGFKGGWLSLWLSRLGARVTGYALAPPTEPSLFVAAGVAEGIVSMEGDIRDYGALAACFAEARPEVVFHLAAQPLVRASYDDPVETFETNVLGTVHVLEAARHALNLRVVINVTSDKCYENQEWPWGYRESDRLGGKDPYSGSKACAEMVASVYANSFFDRGRTAGPVTLASVRAGNVLGGGDWGADRLLPDLARVLAAGGRPLIRNPDSIRPWQHVLDPLAGYLALAEALWTGGRDYAGPWNFGPAVDDARPVRWLADGFCDAWGDAAHWLDAREDDAPPEARVLKLDCSRARSLLGWAPRLPLADALGWTVEWYRDFYAGKDMVTRTLAQIERYATLGEAP
ncbi:MAG: CDP-glucose 4,6-dehydratase [Gammaproteobacteria bacterium]|nr:CDP-glucose 4,6-dehydratase [Gammaproteobacteria bacterium]